MSSAPITGSPDLSLNTLSHFLDRFVFKNPKKPKDKDGKGGKGPSAMQPAAHADVNGVRLVKGEAQDAGGLMNEAAFARKRREDVPVDQVSNAFCP